MPGSISAYYCPYHRQPFWHYIISTCSLSSLHYTYYWRSCCWWMTLLKWRGPSWVIACRWWYVVMVRCFCRAWSRFRREICCGCGRGFDVRGSGCWRFCRRGGIFRLRLGCVIEWLVALRMRCLSGGMCSLLYRLNIPTSQYHFFLVDNISPPHINFPTASKNQSHSHAFSSTNLKKH